MSKLHLSSLLLLLLISYTTAAKATSPENLPPAPIGFEWALLENMSDEFNGKTLDSSKWFDHVPTWRGRPPAEFLPKNVSVGGGTLKIKTSTHPAPKEPFKTGGGAVAGKHQHIYGYFSARLKASRTKMSTTFWLHSDHPEDLHKGCEKSHSIELDILEAIGGWPSPSWSNVMHSNTHYKPHDRVGGKCEGSQYLSKGAKYDTGANLADDFHTFAAWWVSPNKFHFYFDGKEVNSIWVEHRRDPLPFNGPMSLRMVSETYNWQPKLIPAGHEPYPTEKELDDPTINTVYYDYVRSYTLRPNTTNLVKSPGFESSKTHKHWKLNGKSELSKLSHTEARGLQLEQGGTTKQEIQLRKNSTYQVNAYAKNKKMGLGARVSVEDRLGNIIRSIQISSVTFSPYTFSFESRDKDKLFLVFENTLPNSTVIDNVSVMQQ